MVLLGFVSLTIEIGIERYSVGKGYEDGSFILFKMLSNYCEKSYPEKR